MTQMELARKVLNNIGWHSLHCSLIEVRDSSKIGRQENDFFIFFLACPTFWHSMVLNLLP